MRRHVLTQQPNAAADVELLDPAALSQVGFTDHAIQRFAQRAGLTTTHRAVVEPIIRDLLAQEGLIAHRPPLWARSKHPGDVAPTDRAVDAADLPSQPASPRPL